MEEILSSIRRIIADEEADGGKTDDDPELGAAEARRPDHDDHEDDDDEDVLELTKVVREGGEVVDLRNDQSTAEPEQAARGEQPHGDLEAGPSRTDDTAIEEDIEFEPTAQERAGSAEPRFESEEKPEVSASHAAARELISESAATATTGAFAKLSHAMQRTPAEESIADDSGRTIEQFMEDMIRPMLKEWLDENMPALVERLVEKEIQKLARRSELI
jgi:cell pole-organizing protein PopZ